MKDLEFTIKDAYDDELWISLQQGDIYIKCGTFENEIKISAGVLRHWVMQTGRVLRTLKKDARIKYVYAIGVVTNNLGDTYEIWYQPNSMDGCCVTLQISSASIPAVLWFDESILKDLLHVLECIESDLAIGDTEREDKAPESLVNTERDDEVIHLWVDDGRVEVTDDWREAAKWLACGIELVHMTFTRKQLESWSKKR